MLEERGDLGLVLAVIGQVLVQRFLGERAELLVGQLAARGADDPQISRDQLVFVQRVERWQQHPLG